MRDAESKADQAKRLTQNYSPGVAKAAAGVKFATDNVAFKTVTRDMERRGASAGLVTDTTFARRLGMSMHEFLSFSGVPPVDYPGAGSLRLWKESTVAAFVKQLGR